MSTRRLLTPAETSAARTARLAAAVSLDHVAASTGLDAARVGDTLLRLGGRTRCSGLVSEILISDRRDQLWAETLTHRVCPPPATRASAIWQRHTPAHTPAHGHGPAAWALRRLPYDEPLPRQACTQRRGFIPTRSVAASHSSCPPAMLTAYAQDSDSEVRSAVFGNEASPPHALAASAGHDTDSRAQAAGNPASPVSLLLGLAADAESHVRSMAAWNSVTPVEALRRLCDDDSALVRSRLAHNSGCPHDILERLTGDSEMATRFAVASHPRCSPLALRVLAADNEDAVAARAAEHQACEPDTLREISKKQFAPARCAVAANPSCPTDVLAALAADGAPAVRRTAEQALHQRT